MIGTLIAKRRVKKAYESLNDRDINAFLSDWAENASFIYPGDLPTISGEAKGKEAVEAWFRKFFEQFSKIDFKVKHVCAEKPAALGGTNILSAAWEVELTNKQGQEFRNSGVTTIDLRGGRAVLVRDYISDTSLLREEWGA